MMKQVIQKSEMKKAVLGAVAAIGLGSMMFAFCTHSVQASELNKSQVVNTSYHAAAQTTQTAPEGYKKANYKLTMNEFSDPIPGTAITMQEAAEIGAQTLFQVYGATLEGESIEMGYFAPTAYFSRGSWEGMIGDPKGDSYYFQVDAVTGKVMAVLSGREMPQKADVGFDQKLMQDSSQYAELSKQAVSRLGKGFGKVTDCAYYGQGYSGGDPEITMEVTFDNGERVRFTFSRFDQRLNGVCYDNWIKETEAGEKKIEQELEDQINNMPGGQTDALDQGELQPILSSSEKK